MKDKPTDSAAMSLFTEAQQATDLTFLEGMIAGARVARGRREELRGRLAA